MSEPLIQIEHYIDAEPTTPEAYQRFLKRMLTLPAELSRFKTVVVDSVSFMELAARKYCQYKLNPFPLFKEGKDMRQWYMGSMTLIEEAISCRIGSLPMNIIVICHIDEDKDEFTEGGSGSVMLRNAAMPGVKYKKRAPAGFGEFYHMEVVRNAAGDRVRQLQTQPDGIWLAGSLIHAPDPCLPVWDELWAEHPKDRKKPYVHILVYGEPHCGKSTFAATAVSDGPMLVLAFDPWGKEKPYLDMGTKVDDAVDELGTPIQLVYA